MRSTLQNTELSEERLIQAAMTGDPEAFNRLVLIYQDIVYHHAWSILQDPEAAADAAQESFIKAYRSVRRFRGGSFRSWILKIVTHTAYDFIRRYKRHPTQPLFSKDDEGEEIETPSWIMDPSPSVQEVAENHEGARQIYRLLNELPDKYRMAITLVDIYDMDYGEAAGVLDVPVGTLKSRLARGRLQMRYKLINSRDYPLPEKYVGNQVPA